MKRSLAALLVAIPVAVLLGCTQPDLDFGKIRMGMEKKEVIARVGHPTKTTLGNNLELWEYQAYDRYGAIKVNERSSFIRFADGRVEAFGLKEDLDAKRPAAGSTDDRTRVAPGRGEVSAAAQPPATLAFDLRTELEKLEKLKKDGLISEVEFRELRQKVLDKAKAQ